ncbi:hypothetical protein F11_02570 [Rhodospirillum rubrum F11]|nr:hypothetical protein F11_02570 [Rhodospirillum rubrum F11]
MAQEVEHAGLDLGLRKRRLDGLGEAHEPIDDSDQDILDAPVSQIVQHLGPELRPFVGLKPQAQTVARPVGQDGRR